MRKIELDEATGVVARLRLANGEAVEADYYVSAMPVDVFKKLIPAR